MRLLVLTEKFVKYITARAGIPKIELLNTLNKRPVFGEQACEADLREGTVDFNKLSEINVVIKMEKFKFNPTDGGITAEVTNIGKLNSSVLNEKSFFRSRFTFYKNKLDVVGIDIV